MNETYTVIKAFPGAKAGAEVTFDPAEAAAYVADGYLIKKDATAAAAVESDVDGIVDSLADQILAKTMGRINEKAKASAPFSMSPGNPAQPKEESSFGEFLQLASWSASPQLQGRYQKARDYLTNKYKVSFNSNFGREYDATVGKGSGGFDGGGNVEKASVQVESTGALGGITVPPQYVNELFRLAGDNSLFMNRCKRYTMVGKQLMIPALDYSKGATGVTPYAGGMSAVWTAENVGFAQQNANFREIELNANLLAGYTQASRTLLADNVVALEQVMTDLFAKTIAFNVDYAVFLGDGVNKPKGMLLSGAAQTFNRANYATNGNLLADLAKCDSYLIPELEGQGMWVLPPSFKQKLYPMNDGSGKVVFLANGAPGPEGAAVMKPSMAVFGKPLFWSQLPASSGSTNDINLVIPSLYALGLRQDLEIGVSEHYAFTTNLLTWRFLFRGDGASLLNTTISLQNGDTVAPFVTVT